MMAHPADGFVAGLAVELGHGLLDGGDRVERRPVPRAGWSEDADCGRAEGGRDVKKPGVVRYRHIGRRERQDTASQICPGQVAGEDPGCFDDLSSERLLAWTADHPDGDTRGCKLFCHVGISMNRPSL